MMAPFGKGKKWGRKSSVEQGFFCYQDTARSFHNKNKETESELDLDLDDM